MILVLKITKKYQITWYWCHWKTLFYCHLRKKETRWLSWVRSRVCKVSREDAAKLVKYLQHWMIDWFIEQHWLINWLSATFFSFKRFNNRSRTIGISIIDLNCPLVLIPILSILSVCRGNISRDGAASQAGAAAAVGLEIFNHIELELASWQICILKSDLNHQLAALVLL